MHVIIFYMKKSIIMTIIISIIITILIGVMLTHRTQDKVSNYDYDYLCTYEADSDEESSTNKIQKNLYIKVDNDSYVDTAIYESVYTSEYFSLATQNLIQELLSMYDEVGGVETNIINSKKNTYVTIKYDYNKIDFKELKNKLSEVIDKESLQYKMNNKLKVEDYTRELKEYSCIKK